MGRVSVKKDKSVYQIAREEKGWSRLTVARELEEFEGGKYSYIDEHRLNKIENELVRIQPDDIVALSKVYKKPELRNHYCCHDCEIGRIDVPNVTYNGGIHEILVNMAISLKTVNHKKIRLMEILEDGQVSGEEVDDFEAISKELDHIAMTIEALQLWCEKMKLEANGK